MYARSSDRGKLLVRLVNRRFDGGHPRLRKLLTGHIIFVFDMPKQHSTFFKGSKVLCEMDLILETVGTYVTSKYIFKADILFN